LIFSLGSSRAFGSAVARWMKLELAPHEERRFDDGEYKFRPMVGVRGRDVYIVHSLYAEPEQSVHDKLCQLLFFIAVVKDAGADRVTAVLPYLCYGRKDSRTSPRDPVVTRYVAQLLEAAGVDCVVALDVHNRSAFDNAFRCRTEHLKAQPLLAEAVLGQLGKQPLVVVSPDSGGVKRAEQFRRELASRLEQELPSAFVEKHRDGQALTGGALVGEVRGRTAVIVDDLISSGATLLRAAEACRSHGASSVFAAATHGLFVAGAERLLEAPGLDGLFITNSVAPPEVLRNHEKLHVIGVEKMFAEAISALDADTKSAVLET
jgi:ribose-phosphate pyrophosphokinase